MNIFQCILSVAAASAATVATAAELPFRDGEKIAFLGDSITELGTKNPLGYVNLVMDGLAAAGLEVTAAPAGKSCCSGIGSHGSSRRKIRAYLQKYARKSEPGRDQQKAGLDVPLLRRQ